MTPSPATTGRRRKGLQNSLPKRPRRQRNVLLLVCVRCVESESRVLATEHAQNAQRGSAGPRMLPTTATERHQESLWMVSHSVRSAAKILLHTVTQSASDDWNSAARRWIRHRHTTGSPWIPDLRGRFAPTTC